MCFHRFGSNRKSPPPVQALEAQSLDAKAVDTIFSNCDAGGLVAQLVKRSKQGPGADKATRILLCNCFLVPKLWFCQNFLHCVVTRETFAGRRDSECHLASWTVTKEKQDGQIPNIHADSFSCHFLRTYCPYFPGNKRYVGDSLYML